MRFALVVCRYTLLEAHRGALFWLSGFALLAAWALAAYLSQVALTETAAVQASVGAALLRGAAVLLIATHTAVAVGREANDGVLEFVLASPMPRPAWYLGRLAGLAASGAVVSAVYGVALSPWGPAAGVAAWSLSLAFECALVAAASLFFTSSLGRPAAALAATVGLYLLGRSLAAMQAIAAGPLAGESTTAFAARLSVDALALLLPRLDEATRTAWIVHQPPSAPELAGAIAGLGIYTLLLCAAGLFDFARRNL